MSLMPLTRAACAALVVLVPILGRTAQAADAPAAGSGWQAAAPLPATARPASLEPQAAPQAQFPQSYPLEQAGLADGVAARFDIAYRAVKGFRPLTLDLYRPVQRGAALPLIVFVHGGGDTRHADAFADLPRALAGLAARGYAVAAVDYRPAGEARYPAAIQDVKAAIRFLRLKAADYGLDPTRVAAWGLGEGGRLAALAGVGCGVAAFDPGGATAPSDCVQAVVDWYGPVTVPDAASPDMLGCAAAACPPGLAQLASPLSFVAVDSPPFLIVQGAADTAVPPAEAQKLYAALKDKGVPAEYQEIPDVGHGFVRAGAPDTAAAMQAMDRTAIFLAKTFAPVGAKAGPVERGPVY
jgi:acetyl esterase/lipase